MATPVSTPAKALTDSGFPRTPGAECLLPFHDIYGASAVPEDGGVITAIFEDDSSASAAVAYDSAPLTALHQALSTTSSTPTPAAVEYNYISPPMVLQHPLSSVQAYGTVTIFLPTSADVGYSPSPSAYYPVATQAQSAATGPLLASAAVGYDVSPPTSINGQSQNTTASSNVYPSAVVANGSSPPAIAPSAGVTFGTFVPTAAMHQSLYAQVQSSGQGVWQTPPTSAAPTVAEQARDHSGAARMVGQGRGQGRSRPDIMIELAEKIIAVDDMKKTIESSNLRNDLQEQRYLVAQEEHKMTVASKDGIIRELEETVERCIVRMSKSEKKIYEERLKYRRQLDELRKERETIVQMKEDFRRKDEESREKYETNTRILELRIEALLLMCELVNAQLAEVIREDENS